MGSASFLLPDLSAAGATGDDPSTHWQYAPRPPKKRERLVHENWRHLGSCSSCRSRRVKCSRLDGADPSCEECLRRGVSCTVRNAGQRYKQRQGSNLATAEAAFGSSTEGRVAKRRSGLARQQQEIPSPPHEILSDDSAEGRIATVETSRAFTATLVSQYLAGTTHKYVCLPSECQCGLLTM